jgi:hypothetical protein
MVPEGMNDGLGWVCFGWVYEDDGSTWVVGLPEGDE